MGPQELGAIGEHFVKETLAAVGMAVQHGGPADLLADGLAIEVKSARLGRYRRGRRGYQFCLRKPGHTDHRHAAVVVLLAYWNVASDPVVFVIPSEALGDRCKVTIPRERPWLYEGRWARYYRRWDVLADVLGAGNFPADGNNGG